MNTQPLIIPTIPSDEEAAVQQIHGMLEEHLGFVPDAMKLYAISPPLLQAFMGTVGYAMSHETLSQPLLAMIRYLGSTAVGCQFCIEMNEQIMLNLGFELEDVRAAKNNVDAAPLEDNEKVLLKFALKSLDDPDAVDASDIQTAKGAGFSDRDIFDAVALGANNRALNYVLRTFNVHAIGAYA